MIVTTLAGPAVEPVGLAEAKAFLRISGAGEDALVGELIAGARTMIEEAIGLALISRTLRVTLDGWPMVLHSRRRMSLPVRLRVRFRRCVLLLPVFSDALRQRIGHWRAILRVRAVLELDA